MGAPEAFRRRGQPPAVEHVIDWTQWHQEPLLADSLILLGWLYAILAGPLRARLAPGEPWLGRCALRFYAGLALFFVAVDSPFDRIGSLYLFSAHVALQLVVLYPAAALVLSGIPAWMIDWVLTVGRTVSVSRSAGSRPELAEGRGSSGSTCPTCVVRVLLRPLTTGAVFVVVTGVWYLPRPYEWALQREWARGIEYLAFFGAALLFWWPLISPSRLLPPIGYGARLVYLFALEVALTAVFSYLLMADHPLYPTYELAPRLIPGLDATNDQVLGGILLSGVSSLVLVGALGVNFLRWARRSEG